MSISILLSYTESSLSAPPSWQSALPARVNKHTTITTKKKWKQTRAFNKVNIFVSSILVYRCFQKKLIPTTFLKNYSFKCLQFFFFFIQRKAREGQRVKDLISQGLNDIGVCRAAPGFAQVC